MKKRFVSVIVLATISFVFVAFHEKVGAANGCPGLLVVKVNTTNALSVGMDDPSPNGRLRFVEVFGNLSETCTGAISGDHVPTF